jgi:alkanesulfonate monooxygenase SsuD/methylene tetrahydromethanopterin reductase-like flavin-dependent oxidoreductase (luciferase family)
MKMEGFPSTGCLATTSHSRPPAWLRAGASGNPGLFSAELAWIPAFAGTTEPQAASSYCRSSLHTYFQSRTRRIQMIKTPNFVLFVSFVVKIHFSALVAALPR